jgi:hypothetical protein
VVFLERSLERRSIEAERYQQIVAGLTQTNNQLSARVLELEAPREARETPETASEGADPGPLVREVIRNPQRGVGSLGTRGGSVDS